MENGYTKDQPPVTPEEKEPSTPGEKALSFLSFFFFGIAAATLLVIIYINTAKDLTVSRYLSPCLYLSFGGGIGFGMLFRTVRRKKENVSPINYVSKLCFSILVLLIVLLSFLSAILTILRS